jgi:hypothetical protein
MRRGVAAVFRGLAVLSTAESCDHPGVDKPTPTIASDVTSVAMTFFISVPPLESVAGEYERNMKIG